MSQWRAVLGAVVFAVVVAAICRFAMPSDEAVYNHPRDGSVRQVQDFLRNNWLDLRLCGPIQWGKVEKTPEGRFRVPCTFPTLTQGKAGVTNAVFLFDSKGQFLDVKTGAEQAGI
jgi:hypothetical protein